MKKMSGDAQRTLRTSARDLGSTTLARIPRQISRACFIVINTNRACRLGIGTTPILRAIKVAELFKSFGYDVCYMADPHCIMFREYFSLFVKRTTEHIVFCYIGQGGEPGPESLIFNDEPLEDQDFVSLVENNRAPGLKVTLMCDFCLESSIFKKIDEFGENTVAISCAGSEDKFSEAPEVFIEQFCRELTNRNELTNMQLQDSLRIIIKRHQLTLAVAANPPELMREPVAEYKPLVERNELIR